MQRHTMTKKKNMVERTGGDICLGPSTNFQGRYKFLSLRSGRKITRHQFYAVPMPTKFSDRLHAMADKESKGKRGLLFEDRTGNDITESVDDVTHGYDVPAGVERGVNGDNNEEHDAEDEEHTETEPTDNDVKIINNPPIEPAPIAIDVDDEDDKETVGVE